jgi:hypothetical protein
MKGCGMIWKAWMLAACVVLLFCGLAEAQDPNVPEDDDAVTAWFLGDHEVLGIRVGYLKRQVEIGGGIAWAMGYEDENDPVAFGAYALYHTPEALNLENLPVLKWAGDHLQGITYFGLHGGIQTTWAGEDERWYVGPIAGAAINKFIFDSVRDEITVVTEVQYNRFSDNDVGAGKDEIRWLLGLRVAIP